MTKKLTSARPKQKLLKTPITDGADVDVDGFPMNRGEYDSFTGDFINESLLTKPDARLTKVLNQHGVMASIACDPNAGFDWCGTEPERLRKVWATIMYLGTQDLPKGWYAKVMGRDTMEEGESFLITRKPITDEQAEHIYAEVSAFYDRRHAREVKNGTVGLCRCEQCDAKRAAKMKK